MDSIIVEVRIPVIGKTLDARIPRSMQLWEAERLISDMAGALEPGLYSTQNEAVLCDFETGRLYDENKIIDDSGITSGSRLLLV